MRKAEDWLELLSDESRADVMKVQIAETEATKRKQFEEECKKTREREGRDGHWVVKGLWACVALALIASMTCVGYRKVEADQAVKMHDESVVKGIMPSPPQK